MDEFVKTPWYQKTDKAAPVARDCPELEAFLAAMERDVMNPDLRKKIRDNLDPDERAFIKELKKEHPKQDLRVRFEDKGHRFVVVDSATEDELLENDLKNPVYYTELPNDPSEEDKNAVINWANEGLDAGEITSEQHKFITKLDKTHAAIPKALYKTHKVDGLGNMLDPIPIRNLTVGVNTPVHAQSK